MERTEIMAHVAEYFGVEPNEDGKYDIDDYDWMAGCYIGSCGRFLSLAEVVKCIESFIYDI